VEKEEGMSKGNPPDEKSLKKKKEYKLKINLNYI
jgi:hypothetical protein